MATIPIPTVNDTASPVALPRIAEADRRILQPAVTNPEYDAYRDWCEANHTARMWQEVAEYYKARLGLWARLQLGWRGLRQMAEVQP